jgi:hypothetical protein
MKRTMCGVSLHRDWESLDVVDSIITLGGGQLNAVADNHTCDRIWTWELCDRTQHSQRLTTVTEYSPVASDSVTIHFFNTVGRTPISTAVVEAASAMPVLYFSIPVDEINGRVPTREEVEFTHVQALLRLSARTTGELRLPVKSASPTKCGSGHSGPSFPTNAFFERFVKRHDGTVECSGQSTPPPDPEP